MSLLPYLESIDRERLLKNHREGKISDREFDDEVGDLAGKSMERNLRITTPGFSFPNLDSPNPDLSGLLGALANTDRAYEKVVGEINQNVPKLVKSIFDDWEVLRKVTGVYSKELQRRWSKRNVVKRQDVLKRAWPGMSTVRRPDFDILRRQLKGPIYHDAIMLPYVNLVDLSRDENLLTFMHSRSGLAPEHFAWSDSFQYKVAVKLEIFKPATPFRNVMLLTDQKTRETYGRLVKLDTNLEETADLHNLIWTDYIFHLEHGLAILRLQKKVYRFLVQCAEILLHDTDLSGPKMGKPLPSMQEMPQESSIPREWPSLAEKNIRKSYQLPQSFSVEALRRLIDAKRDEAQDSFWAARIDPEYFQAQVALNSQQKLEPVRLMSRQTPFKTSYKSEDSSLNQACISVIQNSCHDIVLWEEIALTVAKVELAKASLETQILDHSKRLPSQYEKALERFLCIMTVGWRYAVRDLSRLFLGSPEFIEFFEIKSAKDGSYTDFVPKKSTKHCLPPLMVLLTDLRDLRLLNEMGALNVLDEMERMISESNQRTQFGTEILEALSRLATFAEIRDMLNRHQPTIQCSQDYGIMIEEDMVRLGVIDKLESLLARIPLIEYVKPQSAFNYPVWKKRTAQHTEQMRSAEAKLDRFWKQVDSGMLNRTGKTLQEWMGGRITSREIQRTPPWQPDEEQRKHKGLPTLIPSQFSCYHENSASATVNFPKEGKNKEKTRGIAYPIEGSSTSEPDATPQTTIEEPPAQIFRLHHRALKTIKAFYPITTEDREGRKMIWKDFLHAMHSLDFEIQKRHGSEWYFEPTWKRNAPITIHEPHPSHEMDFRRMRFEANRMGRKYGWSNASFHAE